MAVTNADLNRLEQRERELRRQMEEQRRLIEAESRNIIAQNSRRLEELRNDTRLAIEERDEKVRSIYDRLLENNLTEQEKKLNGGLSLLRSEYENVCAEIRSSEAELRMKNEQLLAEQRDFEAAYYAGREREKKNAEDVLARLTEECGRFENEIPSDWFLEGHSALYRSRIGMLTGFISGGLYETAAAAGEGVLLNIRLDRITIQDELRKWIYTYTVLCDAAESARDMLFRRGLELERGILYAAKVFGIVNNTISEKQADEWTGSQYSSLIERAGRCFEILEPFRDESGKYTPAEDIPKLMIGSPAKKISAADLYSAAGRSRTLIDDISACIRELRGKIAAFEERCRLVFAGDGGLRKLLMDEGYIISGVTGIDGSSVGDAAVINFTDNMSVMRFEVMIIPVMRNYDKKWINFADWFFPPEASPERISEIRAVMADAFTAKDISVNMMPMTAGQDTEERKRESVFGKKMLINGRVN